MEPSEVKSCFVGIDVSKRVLDIYILPQKTRFQVENGDFTKLCKQLEPISPTLIVLEASGGYEDGAYRALAKAGFKVRREHASHIYHHRKSRGKRAKTDNIDAETIAHYAQCHGDELQDQTPPEQRQECLRQLMDRRNDLLKQQTAEKNRMKAPVLDPVIKASVKRTLSFLAKEIAKVEQCLAKEIEAQEDFRKKQELLKTASGVGEVVANAILAWLPELGTFSHKQLAALVGLAPYHHESGQYKGERHIQGGRANIRCALYLATLSAIRCKSPLYETYQRLIEKGKPKKVAITACSHKLLRILNAMLRKKEAFKAA